MTTLKEPASMDECSFFTRRILADGTKLLAWVPKGITVLNVIYSCAKCKHHGEITQEFQKPVTFHCQKCGCEIFVEPFNKRRGRKKSA
jgi:DNA-directed RNA polymerase subunit RPC12/RpoP